MNRLALSIFVATLGASPALATGYVAPMVEPIPYVAPDPVADWTGTYIGLSYARHGSGEMTFANPPTGTFTFNTQAGWGAVIGHTRQRGAWVFGGELAYYNNDQRVVGFPNAGLEDILDVSGRVGRAWGAFQLYGLVGLSSGNYFEFADDWRLTGVHLGVGVEYLVGRRFSVGLQYVTRRFSGDNPNGLGQTVSIDHDTVSLRGMFRF